MKGLGFGVWTLKCIVMRACRIKGLHSTYTALAAEYYVASVTCQKEHKKIVPKEGCPGNSTEKVAKTCLL